MSARPEELDPSMAPVDTEPIRHVLWRMHEDRRANFVGAIDRFAEEAQSRGGRDFDSRKAAQVMGALTAVSFTLASLPRWVGEALAAALDLDPKVLWPESVPPPLRSVPTSGTGRVPCVALSTPRPAQGKGGSGANPPVPPPASPAKACTKCHVVQPLDLNHFRQMGMLVKKPRRPRWASWCRECERQTGRRYAAEQRVRKVATGGLPSEFRFPCRKPGCSGGSDRNEWGRGLHEIRAHGQLYGDKGDPPGHMIHRRADRPAYDPSPEGAGGDEVVCAPSVPSAPTGPKPRSAQP